MSHKQTIRRELRNAKRVLDRPELFSPSLIEIALKVIKSANDRGIYLTPARFEDTCAAYEGASNVIPMHRITT